MKPVALSRGRGISLLNDLGHVTYGEAVIVQKYIENPLLIDGYKVHNDTTIIFIYIYIYILSNVSLSLALFECEWVRFLSGPLSIDHHTHIYIYIYIYIYMNLIPDMDISICLILQAVCVSVSRRGTILIGQNYIQIMDDGMLASVEPCIDRVKRRKSLDVSRAKSGGVTRIYIYIYIHINICVYIDR
jgi:hypothetical protein